MNIRWFGQSSFLVEADDVRVALDPFDEISGLRWDYEPFQDVAADVLVITHEHPDHNGAQRIVGTSAVVRSTAGRFETPAGEVVAIASEHDDAAGTQRGLNSIVVFSAGGLRWCHLGDFGQSALRPEQRAAIGSIDVLFVPVGGNATIGGATSAALATELSPRAIVPMHYRTPAIDVLDPPDAFFDAVGDLTIHLAEQSVVELDELLGDPGAPTVIVPAPPVRA